MDENGRLVFCNLETHERSNLPPTAATDLELSPEQRAAFEALFQFRNRSGGSKEKEEEFEEKIINKGERVNTSVISLRHWPDICNICE